ncbi:MAG: choice-of-anchor I family protein [Sporocytophaga sp.]|uniref:choice-of-anchor I family protein n=1 Tax=Sporocytophaga sp. TaxID=2231183 RepID=UPI001B2EA8BC|nr:choice-of-anchor I family protein [Sporocytophaga sp.]MBO9703435.1 choice-of-anchor I family protein [Sporocytophaga sp.]
MTNKHVLKLMVCLLAGNLAMAQDLVQYWNFNQTASQAELLTPTISKVSGASILHVPGISSSTVEFTSNTGQDFSTLNARQGEEALSHLRFNNPVGGQLIFSLPTTGYANPIITYVTRRSTQSARAQIISYTIDGTNYIRFDSLEIIEIPSLITLDFSDIAETDNNKDFKIKVEFVQVAGNGAGNNRFDNFALDATSVSGDVNAPGVSFSPANGSVNIPMNASLLATFNEDIKLAGGVTITNENIAQAIELKLNNKDGESIEFSATIDGRQVSITPSENLINGQNYYMAIKADAVQDLSGNVLTEALGITFKTIATQSVLNPGDLLIIAYRMNSSDRADEFAFVALKDILPGTLINFTDGKFTNEGVQCPGGLIWMAPETGIKKGEVVVIGNDSPASADKGSVTGSSFGLSSDGDQIMIYTGTTESPSYITALSSNAWVNDKPSCSGGSTSKLPNTLTDGQSSINLSSALGNIDGLSVNAYYSGPQNIMETEALKASILNPANWTSITKGTPAQTWPQFSFLTVTPSVVKSEVLNASTIRLVFDRNLNTASATSLGNFAGIEGIASATVTSNGSLSDTIVLSFETAFTSGNTYKLIVSNILDAEGNSMEGTYEFSFTYNSSIAFEKEFYTIKEDAGTLSINLKIENPTNASFDLTLKPQPWSTAATSDITFESKTIHVTGEEGNIIKLDIPVVNDTDAENDEYFVLGIENTSGISVSGFPYATVYIKDNDKSVPSSNGEIILNHIASFDPSTEGSTTEAIAYDATTHRIYATSAIQNRFDIIDFSNPAAPQTIRSVSMSAYGSGITGIAVNKGIVAVGAPANVDIDNGSIVFFNADGDFATQVTVGTLPDMVCFTPDGNKVLIANEGQPNNSYSIDPEGSVSVIDVSKGLNSISQTNVTTLDFTKFNENEGALIAAGIRKGSVKSTLSQDLEPEYITVSSDSKKAWVTLQENNSIAELDLENNQITSIWGLGTKEYIQYGNGADMSNNNGEVLIANWPVKGLHMPDAVGSFELNGTNYVVTANEGDEREYAGLNERTTVGNNSVVLDPEKFPHAAVLKKSYNLGNFRITNLNGDTDKDGDYDELYAGGSRSFSIFNADTKELVYDSGDDFDYITSRHAIYGSLFNSDHESNKLKGRSHTKGCEPEALAVATIGTKTYAFVGLERIGGVMAYNISDPENPVFVDYQNTRSFTSYAGDHGPEYVVYVSPENSPDGQHYILVSNEISGTITVFKLEVSGVAEVEAPMPKESSLVVYPNPARNTLNLNKISSFEIESLNGQTLLKAESVNSIDISSLGKGFYILKTSEGQIRKIVVE